MILLNVFVDRFNEGGPFLMSMILISLLCALVFLIIGFMSLKNNPQKSKRMRSMASDVSILGLVFGFLGSVIGLIGAFDSVQDIENVNNSVMMASGLKVSFLTAVFGAFTFILPRIGILILRGFQNK